MRDERPRWLPEEEWLSIHDTTITSVEIRTFGSFRVLPVALSTRDIEEPSARGRKEVSVRGP